MIYTIQNADDYLKQRRKIFNNKTARRFNRPEQNKNETQRKRNNESKKYIRRIKIDIYRILTFRSKENFKKRKQRRSFCLQFCLWIKWNEKNETFVFWMKMDERLKKKNRFAVKLIEKVPSEKRKKNQTSVMKKTNEKRSANGVECSIVDTSGESYCSFACLFDSVWFGLFAVSFILN